MEYRFEGDPQRSLLLFRAVGAPHVLRARIFQGPYSREIWQALMSLNNGQNKPSRPVDAVLPRVFAGTDNTGENRRKMILQPLGSGRTVLEFDQPIPGTLPEAIRHALADVQPLPDPRVPVLSPAATGDHDEVQPGQRLDLPDRPEVERQPGKHRRHGKPAKRKRKLRAVPGR